jgi:hypothetical protein
MTPLVNIQRALVCTSKSRKELTMTNLKIVLLLGLLALVLTLTNCTGATMGNGPVAADGNWGPGTSAPQIYMTPNGDRVGHYAPYFYPDGGGSEKR